VKAAAHITTPQAYIDSLADDRRAAITALDAMIRKAAPALQVHIMSGLLGYGHYHYKYASGREGDWFVVGLANQKNYISLYLCVCDDTGYLAEQNAARLGKVSVGKSCIRFKKLEDLDMTVAAELVKRAAQLAKAGRFGM
jgi:hypothetical protein